MQREEKTKTEERCVRRYGVVYLLAAGIFSTEYARYRQKYALNCYRLLRVFFFSVFIFDISNGHRTLSSQILYSFYNFHRCAHLNISAEKCSADNNNKEWHWHRARMVVAHNCGDSDELWFSNAEFITQLNVHILWPTERRKMILRFAHTEILFPNRNESNHVSGCRKH